MESNEKVDFESQWEKDIQELESLFHNISSESNHQGYERSLLVCSSPKIQEGLPCDEDSSISNRDELISNLEDNLNRLIVEDYGIKCERNNTCLAGDNVEICDEIFEFQREIHRLSALNMELKRENDELRRRRPVVGSEEVLTLSAFDELERLYVEAKCKLAQAMSDIDDMEIIKCSLVEKLQKEQQRRIVAEKERDAYCAAYEATIRHIKTHIKDMEY